MLSRFPSALTCYLIYHFALRLQNLPLSGHLSTKYSGNAVAQCRSEQFHNFPRDAVRQVLTLGKMKAI